MNHSKYESYKIKYRWNYHIHKSNIMNTCNVSAILIFFSPNDIVTLFSILTLYDVVGLLEKKGRCFAKCQE